LEFIVNTPLDPVELTRAMVRMDTRNPEAIELPCAQYLAERLETMGFHVHFEDFAEGRPNIIARIGNGAKAPLAFTGHMDTVPLGAAAWNHDPFGAEISGDRLYGRGASDMKSGLAAILAALSRFDTLSAATAPIVLVFTAAEESACQGAAFLAESRPGLLEPCGALVVAEPTANYPWLGHRGCLWFEICTHGKTAHGSMPEEGVNAIYKMAHAVTKLEYYRFDTAPHPVLGMPSLNVGTIKGGVNVNSVPDYARAQVDVRTTPEVDSARLLSELAELLGSDVELTETVSAPCVYTAPDRPWVRQVYAIMKEMLGDPIEPRAATYFTDAGALVPAMGNPPTILLGPGEPTQAHKTDEYCLISRIHQAADAYERIITQYCGL